MFFFDMYNGDRSCFDQYVFLSAVYNKVFTKMGALNFSLKKYLKDCRLWFVQFVTNIFQFICQ